MDSGGGIVMANINAAFIRQGTTPAVEIILKDKAVQDDTVYVTFQQSDVSITKSNYGDDASVILEPIYSGNVQTDTKITVFLSQTETLALHPGYCKVQVGYVTEDDESDVSDIARLEIGKSLYKGGMIYG
jgi:hypothetical protein